MKKSRKNLSDFKITDRELRDAFNQCDDKGEGAVQIKKLKVILNLLKSLIYIF